MDFQSAMETFAEAWVAANTKGTPLSEVATQSQALALTRGCKSPPPPPPPVSTPVIARGSSRDSAERTPTPLPLRSASPADTIVSPSSVKDEFNHSKISTVKSLPVHCVVETVWNLDENRTPPQLPPWRRRSLVETDSYVIIPVGTPFQGLVHSALSRLGYSAESAAAARGTIIIKNWKPLTFDQITDDPLVTVGDILGELTAVATLRIQMFRNRPDALSELKDKLLRFLLMQSHGVLMSSGCPIDELILSQICRGNSDASLPELSEECRRKFDQWWSSQFRPHSPPQYCPQYTVPPKTIERPESHPALLQNQFTTQKTRMRTSFDPELELPKLQGWFADNQHPSRQQIQQYVKELNSLESRRGRKPLDINNVVYWFKNARAAQKRAEMRNVGPSLSSQLAVNVNGYGPNGIHNGAGLLMRDGYSERLSEHNLSHYRSSNQMCDEFSNATSDMDDEDTTEGQPASPVGPLSLTTGRKCKSENGSPLRPPSPVHIDLAKAEHKPENYQSDSKVSISNVDDKEMDGNEEGRSAGTSPSSQHFPQNLCRSPESNGPMMSRGEGLDRLAAGFPLVPNSMFGHGIMYMSHYLPGLSHATVSPPNSGAMSLTADERRKRNRTFIDPVTEVPRLEQWFSLNTHPSHNLILKYTEELNCMAYRQKFPRLEPKNVQFWFKNRRAKCKRLKMSLFDNQLSVQYHHGDGE